MATALLLAMVGATPVTCQTAVVGRSAGDVDEAVIERALGFAEAALVKQGVVGATELDAALGDERYRQSAEVAAKVAPLLGKCGGKRAVGAAAGNLAEIADQLAASVAYLVEVRPWAEAQLGLAFCRLRKKPGAEALGEAAEFIEAALAVAPDIELPAALVDKPMEKLLGETRERLSTAPSASLRVESSPTGARVEVDGKFVGVTPLQVDVPGYGAHLVRLRKQGYQPSGNVVAMPAADLTAKLDEANVAPQLAAAAELRVRRAIGEKVEKLDPPLYNSFGAQRLLRIDVTPSANDSGNVLLIAAFDVASEERLYVSQPLPLKDIAEEAFAEYVQTEVVRAQNAQAAGGAKREAAVLMTDKSVLDDPDFYCLGMRCGTARTVAVATAITGATVLATGLVLQIMAKGKNDQYRESMQLTPEADELRSSGQQYALIGDIAAGSGGLLAVLGVTSYILWQGRGEQPKLEAEAPQVRLQPGPGAFGVALTLDY